MKDIIKKAIEGGAFGNPDKVKDFNWFIKDDLIHFDNGENGVMLSLHKQLMRPEFWQSLFGEKSNEQAMTFFGFVFASEYGFDKAVKWLEDIIK